MKRLNTKGFTIIELLIATVVFSLILLIITGAITQISNIYYKGVINTKTQEVARAVMEDIAKKVQYSTDNPVPLGGAGVAPYNTSGAYQIGDTFYKFRYDQQVNGSRHALTRGIGGGGFDFSNDANDDVELLATSMQVRHFRITSVGSAWKIELTVAYGEDIDGSGANSRCKTLRLGGQFCAVANYQTTVTKRL